MSVPLLASAPSVSAARACRAPRGPGWAMAALLGVVLPLASGLVGCAHTAVPALPRGTRLPPGGQAAYDIARNEGLAQRVEPSPEPAPAPTPPRAGGLSGVVIRVIYVERRKDDAETAARRLRRLGAEVALFNTSDAGNEPHAGTLYTQAGYERYVDAIRASVGSLEELRPKVGGVFSDGQHFNLWIVR